MESFFQILDTACWLFSSKFKLCFYITNLAWLCLAQSQLYHVLIFLHQSCIMPNSKFPPTAFKIIFNLFPLSVPFWFITCSNFVSMALKEFQKLCKIFRSVLFSSLLVICVVFLCIYIFDETLSRSSAHAHYWCLSCDMVIPSTRRVIVYMYTNSVSYGDCRSRVAIAAVVVQSARPGAAQTLPSSKEWVAVLNVYKMIYMNICNTTSEGQRP